MREPLFGKAEGKARRRLQFVLLAFVLGLAAVAAGCGGGDDGSTGAAATGTSASGGACDKEIWVLLPDSASSPRWESDDRPYFDKAFNDAGAKHTIVNAEGDAATQLADELAREPHPIFAGRSRAIIQGLTTG